MPLSCTDAALPSGLDGEVEQVIAACGGDPKEAVRALVVSNAHLQAELASLDAEMAQLLADVSRGYARGHWDWLLERADVPIPYLR
ncbi:hypothetical protein [Labrys monachus]|uniref:Uncharacterized protein n=1 Tax=Labrys monachus TaxID=217067 RepID=A0ABU0FDA3_9HYPH|nr:hypothetical protein [Labrys monachus]MDQ0392589.1 hypothetical protein [Labrys monachus]